MANVLVTGGTGFVGGHQIVRLLSDGNRVRATLRNASQADELRDMVRVAGVDDVGRLEFAEADLAYDDGWPQALKGCDYAMHIASPFPSGAVADEDRLIGTARDGTLRVLRAARDAGVKRVVLTSSFAAIGYGHPENGRAFTEADWSDPDGRDVQPYVRSKIVAERAAWDFIANQGGGLELTVVNPVGIFGPVLGARLSSSIVLVQRLLQGMPGVPRLNFGIVDVRDLVKLQSKALTAPSAAGERFMAVAEPQLSLFEVARILRDELGPDAHKVPTRQLPDWLVRLGALMSPQLRELVPQLGRIRLASSDKARHLLGWQTRPVAQTMADTARSLIELGCV
ncbi:NAD-dependent epimerase/dehydratase family protein [Alteraurantiacibacter aquimixticola]|uniref:NAD-dependent epimerase/dehydratase family protein n=1 Tax=Alteraurantiacibacter aquimixticola TaxID=2489173 RepID=A0A4T3F1W4_9SPHN|nr:NAD-dependent epimerase/dehydratase family protein [Alteraurantiacibacter aquimixticola]TIX51156.1 NAD-dependent epimerase/dehydratase family protein [Alteraurantiacibacter aquimixticola]